MLFGVAVFSGPAVAVVDAPVVVAGALVAAGAEVVVVLPNKLGAAVLVDAAGAEVVAVPKREGVLAGAETDVEVVVGAEVVENSEGADVAELVVAEPTPPPPKRLGVDAGAVVAALLAGAVVAAGFVPNRVLTAGVLAVVLAGLSAGFEVVAPPPKRLDVGVDEAAPVEGFPNMLGVPLDPEAAGVAPVAPPKRLGVPELLVAG
jgi:hypothetical protein